MSDMKNNDDDDDDSDLIRISKLFIHPIKSFKAVEVNSSKVTKCGLEFDRAFCVIDKETGDFIPQRTCPLMALVEVSFTSNVIDYINNNNNFCDDEEDDTDTEQSFMILKSANCVDELRIPLKAKGEEEDCEVTVWDYCGVHKQESDEINEWIAQAIDYPQAKLVRWVGNHAIPERFNRNVSSKDKESRPRRSLDEKFVGKGYKGETAFSDGYPILLCSENSLQDLQNRVIMGKKLFSLAGSEVKMNRFRPNIVVSGAKEWIEDKWSSIETTTSSKIAFDLVKPCSRCTIPDINQETGIFDKTREVSRALQKFRSGAVLGSETPTWQQEIFFGWNLVYKEQQQQQQKVERDPRISVGDVIKVTAFRTTQKPSTFM